MIDELPFVEHAQAKAVFERLKAIMRIKGLGIMEGTRATGKTRILEEFITKQRSGLAGDQIVLVSLHKTGSWSLRVIVSPMAHPAHAQFHTKCARAQNLPENVAQ